VTSSEQNHVHLGCQAGGRRSGTRRASCRVCLSRHPETATAVPRPHATMVQPFGTDRPCARTVQRRQGFDVLDTAFLPCLNHGTAEMCVRFFSSISSDLAARSAEASKEKPRANMASASSIGLHSLSVNGPCKARLSRLEPSRDGEMTQPVICHPNSLDLAALILGAAIQREVVKLQQLDIDSGRHDFAYPDGNGLSAWRSGTTRTASFAD